ncbi:hypothetical protein CsSME_00042832 [Camellia sinensis var. sinensis]
MGSMEEGAFPVKLNSASDSDSSWNPTDGVIFFGISMVMGIASRHLLRGTRVPYTVALLILGIALGSLEYGTHHQLGRIGDGIRLWANIDPNLLLAIFLPALLFESSFAMEVHQIKRCMAQMILLAGPGVLISTFCLGAALKLTFPYQWSWKMSLLLGGLLSATDPVAVVALLKELGASKKLSTIIEGESLMNDGTAIVVYQLFYRMVLGQSFNVGSVLKFLTQVSLGAVGIGLAFGIASVLWLGFIFNDTVIEIALTLTVSYIAYFTAQEGADVSGVLAVMTLGMFYAAVARTAFKSDGQQSLHHFCFVHSHKATLFSLWHEHKRVAGARGVKSTQFYQSRISLFFIFFLSLKIIIDLKGRTMMLFLVSIIFQLSILMLYCCVLVLSVLIASHWVF